MAYPRWLPSTTRLGASPAIKSSNVGPEERVSENFDFGGTGPEAVARKRACRGNLDGLRAMFIEEGESQVTVSVCSGLPMIWSPVS